MLSTLQITHYQQLPLDDTLIHFVAVRQWPMNVAEKVK